MGVLSNSNDIYKAGLYFILSRHFLWRSVHTRWVNLTLADCQSLAYNEVWGSSGCTAKLNVRQWAECGYCT